MKSYNFIIGLIILVGIFSSNIVVQGDNLAYNLELVSSFGGTGSGDGQLNTPHGVGYNGSHLFVAEYSNNRIQIFDSTNNYVSQFPLAKARGVVANTTHIIGINNTHIITFDDSGNILDYFNNSAYDMEALYYNTTHFISIDCANPKVLIFDRSLNLVDTFGSIGTGTGQFAGSFSACKLTYNETYIAVADDTTNKILLFDPSGNYVSNFTAIQSFGLAYYQNHWISGDYANKKLDIFDNNLNYIDSWDLSTYPNFNQLRTLDISTNGTHLFVSDDLNNYIHIFQGNQNVVRETEISTTTETSIQTDISTTTKTDTITQTFTLTENNSGHVSNTEPSFAPFPIISTLVILPVISGILLQRRKRN